jgi:hypothetical protein
MILIPVMSWFTADSFLKENAGKQWIVFPPSFYLTEMADPTILIKIITTIGFMLIMYGTLTLFSFIIFRLFAPPRYSPLDAPPVSYKGKPYKR